MNEELQSKFKKLKIYYIAHISVYGIIIIFNIILTIEVYWLLIIYYYLYFYLTIFGIIYFVIPIIPFTYFFLNRYSLKFIRVFQIFSIVFCVLALITGLCFSMILMINSLDSNVFCQDCPFNLPNSYIDNLYKDYKTQNINEKKLEKQCKNRRCLFNKIIENNEYLYEYICNYEPTEEFEKIKNDLNQTIEQIICEKLVIQNEYNNKYNIEENNIIIFYEMCNSYDNFYICQRITEPKKYTLNENYVCPQKSYLKYLIFYSLLCVFLNLIIGFIPWRIEYSEYKQIITCSRRNINSDSKSLNSTNISQNSKDDIERSFKKEATQTIIVYNESIINNDKQNNLITNNDESNKKIKEANNNILQIKRRINDKNINKNNLDFNINNIRNNENNNINKINKLPKDLNNKDNLLNTFNNPKEKENKKIIEKFTCSNSHKISMSERNFVGDSSSSLDL